MAEHHGKAWHRVARASGGTPGAARRDGPARVGGGRGRGDEYVRAWAGCGGGAEGDGQHNHKVHGGMADAVSIYADAATAAGSAARVQLYVHGVRLLSVSLF
jgi:MOSC domain-containing protein YiiM